MGRRYVRSIALTMGLVAGASCVALLFWSYSYEIRPRGIIIHHSALMPPGSDSLADAAVIDRIHQRRGFRAFYRGRIYHIGYHYVILRDGTVQAGRPETCRGAHARGYNDYIGICVLSRCAE